MDNETSENFAQKMKKNDGSASQSFNCTMCDLSYTLKNNLRRHVRNKH